MNSLVRSIETLPARCWQLCDPSGMPYEQHHPDLGEAMAAARRDAATTGATLTVERVDQPCAVVCCVGCGTAWDDGVHLTPDVLDLPAGDGWRVDQHARMAWCPDCAATAPAPDPLTVPVRVADGQLLLPGV
jgi:hypothetical protein